MYLRQEQNAVRVYLQILDICWIFVYLSCLAEIIHPSTWKGDRETAKMSN